MELSHARGGETRFRFEPSHAGAGTPAQSVGAAALRRHRLAEGRYPETLAAVAPRFLDKLPPDVISGQPLHYRLDDAGQPVIYSVGWNGTDDGGTVGLNNSTPPGIDATKGDWVWSYSSR